MENPPTQPSAVEEEAVLTRVTPRRVLGCSQLGAGVEEEGKPAGRRLLAAGINSDSLITPH